MRSVARLRTKFSNQGFSWSLNFLSLADRVKTVFSSANFKATLFTSSGLMEYKIGLIQAAGSASMYPVKLVRIAEVSPWRRMAFPRASSVGLPTSAAKVFPFSPVIKIKASERLSFSRRLGLLVSSPKFSVFWRDEIKGSKRFSISAGRSKRSLTTQSPLRCSMVDVFPPLLMTRRAG